MKTFNLKLLVLGIFAISFVTGCYSAPARVELSSSADLTSLHRGQIISVAESVFAPAPTVGSLVLATFEGELLYDDNVLEVVKTSDTNSVGCSSLIPASNITRFSLPYYEGRVRSLLTSTERSDLGQGQMTICAFKVKSTAPLGD